MREVKIELWGTVFKGLYTMNFRPSRPDAALFLAGHRRLSGESRAKARAVALLSWHAQALTASAQHGEKTFAQKNQR